METLKSGSKGALVKYLQTKLADLGHMVTADGIFDNELNMAVKDFQAKNNLTADGIVGGLTWTALYLQTEKPRTATSRHDRHNNILHLHPTVRTAVVKVYTQLQSEGIPFKIFEAFRYPERQAELYAQGRSKPGSIVTYAQPWSSYHQYGLAVDFVIMINGEWSWSMDGAKMTWWSRMHGLGYQEGLMHLQFETPHLQIIGTSSSALRSGVYPRGGDKAWTDNLTAAINGV